MNYYKTLFNRILPVAAIVAMLYVVVGCEQKEELTVKEQTEGIVFHPTLDGQEVVVTTAQTRVADIDLKTFGFTVCGYQSVAGSFEDKKAQATPNVFADKSLETGGAFQVVNYIADKKKFMTPERPWVVAAEDFLSFFAWSDNGPTGTKGIIGHSSASATGYPTVNISVCNKIVDQPDIVVAQAVNLRNNALISAIDLQFKHILAKISFKGYSSSGTSIAIKKFDVKYSGSTKSKATYSFDPAVAAAKGFPFIYDDTSGHDKNSYYPVSSTTYPSVTEKSPAPATAVLLGSMMQIPQDAASGFITVRVTYSIEGTAGVAGPEQTRDITIPAMKLEGGHHYTLAFDFVADKVQVSVNSVADWNEMTSTRLPLVAGPRGDVMLWLDGGDEPYTFNGDQYWLDRSGYNRHCKLVNPNLKIAYNAAEKVYQFNTYANAFANYFWLEGLGTINEVTVQLLMRTNPKSNSYSFQTPLFYRQTKLAALPSKSERQLLVHFEDASNRFDFDCYVGGPGNWLPQNKHSDFERMSIEGLTATQRNTYSLYTCRRKSGYSSVARNDNYENSWTGDSKACPFKLEAGYLGAQFDGDIKMVKIIKSSIPYEQIESDYAHFKSLHKLPDDPIIPIGKLPTKSPNGLIAYFDANDAPTSEYNQYTNETTYRWRDRTGYGNHLAITGYNNGISYDNTNKYYLFNGNNKNAFMRIVKSLGVLKNYWVEFGLVNQGVDSGGTTSGTTVERVLIHFAKDDRTVSADNGFIWYFPNKNNNLWGYNNGSLYRFDDALASTTDTNIWGIGRSVKEFNIVRNNTFADGISIGTYAPRLDYCYIGNNAAQTMPFKGKIKTIRIYNRVPMASELSTMKTEVTAGIK